MIPRELSVKLEDENLQFNLGINKLEGPFFITHQYGLKGVHAKRDGKWNLKENARYGAYILKNAKKLQGKPHKLLWEEYKKMAEFIKTRNFRQCKSYHQQLCSSFENIPSIIAFLQRQNKELSKFFQEQLKNLHFKQKYPQKLDNQISIQLPTLESLPNYKSVQQSLPKTADEYHSQNTSTNQISFEHRAFQKYSSSANKQQEWLECHQLFIEWTTKLKELMLYQPRY